MTLLSTPSATKPLPSYDRAMPPPSKPAARFMTIEQVAEELSVGIPQVRSLLKSGELRGLQIGARRLWRIGMQDFEDYITEAYRQAAERIEVGLVDELPAEAEARKGWVDALRPASSEPPY